MSSLSLQEHIDQARRASDAGDRSTALVHFQEAFRLQPMHETLPVSMAVELRELGRLDEAQSLLDALLQRRPDSLPGWIGLGHLARKRGCRAQSLEYFRKALSLQPSHSILPADVAADLCELGRFDEAQTVLEDLVQRQPEALQGWIGLGHLARKRGRPAQSLEHFRKALNLQRQSPTLPLDIAADLRELGRFDEAQAVLEDLVQRQPGALQAWISLGHLARRQSRHAQSLEHFRKALSLQPESPTLPVDIATALRELGQFDEAQALLQDFVQRRPDALHGWIGLGHLARQQGRHEKSLEHFRYALNLQPDSLTLPVDIATDLRELGRIDEAQVLLEDFVRRHPDALQGWIGLGHLARKRDQRTQALAHFRKALSLQPENPWLPIDIAADLRELGRLDEAEATLEALAEKQPNAAQAWMALGHGARAQGFHEKALSHFLKAMQLQHSDPAAPIGVATALQQLGRFDDAKKLLLSQLDTHPAPSELYLALGNIANFEINPEEALIQYEKGMNAEPHKPHCYISYIWTCIHLGLLENAQEALKKSFICKTLRIHFRTLEAHLLRNQGMLDQALLIAKEIWSEHANNFNCSHLLAETLIMTAAFEDAEKVIFQMKASNQSEKFSVLMLQCRLRGAQYELAQATGLCLSALDFAPKAQAANVHRHLVELYLMQGNAEAAGRHIKLTQSITLQDSDKRQQEIMAKWLCLDIWRELNANPTVQDALSETEHLTFHEKSKAFHNLLKDECGHFAVIFTWLNLMARHKVWAHPQSLDSTVHSKNIPLRIVQFWDTADIPEEMHEAMRSWSDRCTGFEHLVFSDETAEAFIRKECAPDILEAFLVANHPAMRADLFRLAFLAVRGGIYVDADDYCQHDLRDWVESGHDLLLLQENIGAIGNNFIAAAPNHPFILASLRTVVHNILMQQGDCIWFISGPGVISLKFCQHFSDDLRKCTSPAGVRVRSQYEMQKRIAMHLPRQYKHDDRGWTTAKKESKPLFRDSKRALGVMPPNTLNRHEPYVTAPMNS